MDHNKNDFPVSLLKIGGVVPQPPPPPPTEKLLLMDGTPLLLMNGNSLDLMET